MSCMSWLSSLNTDLHSVITSDHNNFCFLTLRHVSCQPEDVIPLFRGSSAVTRKLKLTCHSKRCHNMKNKPKHFSSVFHRLSVNSTGKKWEKVEKVHLLFRNSFRQRARTPLPGFVAKTRAASFCFQTRGRSDKTAVSSKNIKSKGS